MSTIDTNFEYKMLVIAHVEKHIPHFQGMSKRQTHFCFNNKYARVGKRRKTINNHREHHIDVVGRLPQNMDILHSG
jgi:hypothetical protein